MIEMNYNIMNENLNLILNQTLNCFGEEYSFHKRITNIFSFFILFLFNFLFVFLPLMISIYQTFKNKNKTRIYIIITQFLIQFTIIILVLFLLFGTIFNNNTIITCSSIYFSIHRLLFCIIFLLFFTSFSIILKYFFNLFSIFRSTENKINQSIFNLIFFILNLILYFTIIIFIIFIFIFNEQQNLFILISQLLGLFVGCNIFFFFFNF